MDSVQIASITLGCFALFCVAVFLFCGIKDSVPNVTPISKMSVAERIERHKQRLRWEEIQKENEEEERKNRITVGVCIRDWRLCLWVSK